MHRPVVPLFIATQTMPGAQGGLHTTPPPTQTPLPLIAIQFWPGPHGGLQLIVPACAVSRVKGVAIDARRLAANSLSTVRRGMPLAMALDSSSNRLDMNSS